MSTRSRRLLVAVPALALACAACGTTVQMPGRTALGGPAAAAGDGLSVPAALPADGPSVELSTASGSAGLPAGAPALGARSAADPAGSVTAAATGGPARGGAPGAATAPGRPLAHGPGVTARTIAVGFPYAPNADQAQAALGNTAVTQGDPKRVVEALVAEINRTGGVAGRKLVAVFHELDAQSSETAAQREQGLCSTYTEDHKVLAVFGATGELLRP